MRSIEAAHLADAVVAWTIDFHLKLKSVKVLSTTLLVLALEEDLLKLRDRGPDLAVFLRIPLVDLALAEPLAIAAVNTLSLGIVVDHALDPPSVLRLLMELLLLIRELGARHDTGVDGRVRTGLLASHDVGCWNVKV